MPFEALREELLRGGVAPRHVRRYLAELEDHLVELIRCEEDAGYEPDDAAIRARAMLGDDALLAEAMLAQPKLRSLTARAPWLVFGLLPPFMAVAVLLVPCLILVSVGRTHHLMMPGATAAPDWFRHFAQIVALSSNLLLGPLLATLAVVTAHRQRLSMKWALIGIVILALFASRLQATFPQPAHHGGSINLSPLFLGGWRDWQAWARQWPMLSAQLFLTLLPAAWLLCLSRRASRI